MKKPFAVNDRVKVYGTTSQINYYCTGAIATILESSPGDLLVEFKHDKQTDRVHPKQCRRIVKKTRRRLWVIFDEPISISTYCNKETAERDSLMLKLPVTEFIEVRKKK